MIDVVFDLCVRLLVYLAEAFGTTYKAINVWIFIILWPVFTLLLIGAVIWQQVRIRKLRRQLETAIVGKL